jgi:Periplasmic copper-binding protein (NosD)/Putative Ig domain
MLSLVACIFRPAGLVASLLLAACSGGSSSSTPPAATNRPPVISGTPATTAVVGAEYEFLPTASDADGDSLTFSIAGKPSWADFDSLTGGLSGMPGPDDEGIHADIVITTSDGSVGTSLDPFSILVEAEGTTPPTGGSCDQLNREIPDPCTHFGFDIFGTYPIADGIAGNHTQDVEITAIGTPSNPYVVDARDATFRRVGLTGQYAILLGGTINAAADGGPFLATQCNYCAIIDMEVAGPGVDTGHSTAVSLSSNSAWVGGLIHGFGDNRPNAAEQDFHGIKIVGNTDVWIIDAEIYDNSGDSIQLGDASRGSASRIYVSGGYMHDNRENAVDIKDSRDVVVSGVRMEGFRPTNSSSGVALVLHDDARDAKILDNIIRDSSIGIVSSGFSGHIIDGNDVQALNVGIQLRNTQNITVTNNVVSAPTRIDRQGGVTGTVQD